MVHVPRRRTRPRCYGLRRLVTLATRTTGRHSFNGPAPGGARLRSPPDRAFDPLKMLTNQEKVSPSHRFCVAPMMDGMVHQNICIQNQ